MVLFSAIPSGKLSFEAKIVPWLSFCCETRLVTPLFYLYFSLIMATQKVYLKEKKNLDSRSYKF